jgi:hypothetical protein
MVTNHESRHRIIPVGSDALYRIGGNRSCEGDDRSDFIEMSTMTYECQNGWGLESPQVGIFYYKKDEILNIREGKGDWQ